MTGILKRVALTTAVFAAAATGTIAVGAAPASAGTVTVPTTCVDSVTNQPRPGPTSWTVTAAPKDANVGDTVNITLTWDFKNESGFNTDDVFDFKSSLTAAGAHSTPIETTGPSIGAVPNGQSKQVTMTGSFVAGTAGTVSISTAVVTFKTRAFGVVPNVTCTPDAATPVAETVTVATGPSLDNLAPARPGTSVPVTGKDFPVSATGTLEFCNADGSGCASAGAASTDATGKLTGNAAIPASATPGDHTIKASAGGKSAPPKLILILGSDREINLNPSSGGPGTSVTVKGGNFDPGASVTLAGLKGTTPTGDTGGPYTVSALGEFTGTITVTSAETTAIAASENDAPTTEFAVKPFASSANSCVANPKCSLNQTITASVKGGTLEMSQTGAQVTLTEVSVGSGAQTSTGSLQNVTVSDLRGGGAGWSLTGKVTDFTGSTGGSLPGGGLAWKPVCAAKPGAVGTVAAGPEAPLGTETALCSATPGAGGVIGGEFSADADLALTIPGFTKAGNYAATLTLTLS